MSAAADALERRNNQVWDAIDARNFKRALDLCNTRIKRGEKADSLDTLKCYTLHFLACVAGTPQTDLPAYSECRTLARALTTRKNPITDTHSLQLLQRIYTIMRFDGAELSGAWERAVKAAPADFELARQWFFSCIRSGDLRGAQKAAMGLQKTWVHEREFYFWAIATTMILFNSLGDDQKDRPIFKTLAYRMAVKTREDAKLSPPPARAIQKPQEIHLLLQVIATCTPKPEDALKEQLAVLDSEDVGVDSKLAEQDWWSFVRKRLELLEELKNWGRIYEICKSLIKSSVENMAGGLPGKGDDWKIWESLLKATEELKKSGEDKVAETREIITFHIEAVPLSRNALLARIRFEKDAVDDKIAAVKQYLERFQSKDCCFPDLKTEVENLDSAAKDLLLEALKENAEKLADGGKPNSKSVIADTNYLKFRYLFKIAPLGAETTEEEQGSTLQSFIKDTLSTYKGAVSLGPTALKTDNHCGDDSAILAAMAWIRLYHLAPSTSKANLVKSVSILEDALSRSAHDYQILLLLTRLYLLLGAPTTALRLYQSLSIKQIQNDTMSHYYFSRISSLLPGDTETSVSLTSVSQVYINIYRQISDMLVTAYEQSSYAQLEGFVQLGDHVKFSQWRAISRLEKLRTIRYRNEPKRDLPKPPKIEYDNRDFGIIYNFELSSQPSFEARFLRTGPLQSLNWISIFDKIEEVAETLEVKDPKLPASASESIVALLSTPATLSELTDPEREHAATVAALAQVLTTPSEQSLTTLTTHLTTITTPPPTPATSLPWERLHREITHLQTLTLLKLAVDSKPLKAAKALRKQVSELKQAATAASKAVKERLQGKDVMLFVDAEVLKEAEEGWEGVEVDVRRWGAGVREGEGEAGRSSVGGWKKGF